MERFYTDILNLQRMSAEYPRHVFFRVSPHCVLLVFNPDETARKQDIPSHGTRGPGHLAFAVKPDELENWRRHLTDRMVAIEREITWPNGAQSIYFRDPAGNSVEIVTEQIWEATIE